MGDRMDIGIIVERVKVDNHPWLEEKVRAIAAIAAAPHIEKAAVLVEGDGFCRVHAATLALELFRGETEGYRVNLSQPVPSIYVVMRLDESGPAQGPTPFHVTVCPFEAEGYACDGDETVDAVPMPLPVREWVSRFVERHHVDVPFRKRKQERFEADTGRKGRAGRSGGRAR